MSLRRKTLLIVLAVAVSLNIIVYGTAQTVLLNSFQQLEEQNARQNVQRALNTVGNELDRLSATTRDYARWDDSYAFIQGQDEEYPTNNLPDDVFTNLGLNLAVFVNNAGEIVFIKTVDLQAGSERASPAGIEDHFQPGDPLLIHADADSSVAGIILLPEGPMLVASRPVTDSFARQPSAGALIFGAFLDDAKIRQFSDSLQLPIQVQLTSDPQLPGDFQTALENGSSVVVHALSNDRVAGYALENDLYGQPALLLRVDMPRDILGQGQASVTLFLALLVVAGIVFVTLTLLLLERFVVSRLMHLSGDVNQISTSGNIGGQVSATGSDELTTLALDINAMLKALEQAQGRERERDQRLRAIVNGAPLLLWSADLNGRLTLLEGRNLDLLGLDSARDTGKAVVDVFRNIPQIITEINRALKGEEFSSLLVVKEMTFDTRYLPARGLDGAITGMIGVATNITERVMAEEALTGAYETLSRKHQELERVNELFRVTLGQVSDTVRRGAPREEITQYIEFVQTEFDRLD
ncbi:MAG: PAS domain S-box protein [Chloroflexi bacterium]|nr:PAS domain S-box protein [Chloroflexota bacterium]